MVKAIDFAVQGSKYIGTPYSKMDCQAFVERCLADAGVHKDWKGSNAMFRDMAWIGSPQECKVSYGSIPVGALLFIWANDGGQVDRGYHDGLGNASHVGIYTGTGLGALHSSSSKGMVCESKFAGKTIPNGGWNRVGLLKMLDYGTESEETHMTNAVIYSANGKAVNFRKQPSKAAATYGALAVGAPVNIIAVDGDWTQIEHGNHIGFVMSEFVKPVVEQAEAPRNDFEQRLASVEEKLDKLLNEWADKIGWG